MPPSVPEPAPPIEEAVLKVIGLLITSEVPEIVRAPAELIPEPFKLMVLALSVSVPAAKLKSRLAPEATEMLAVLLVPLPKAAVFCALSEPAVIVVAPV